MIKQKKWCYLRDLIISGTEIFITSFSWCAEIQWSCCFRCKVWIWLFSAIKSGACLAVRHFIAHHIFMSNNNDWNVCLPVCPSVCLLECYLLQNHLSPPKPLEQQPPKWAWQKPMGILRLQAILHNSLANTFVVIIIFFHQTPPTHLSHHLLINSHTPISTCGQSQTTKFSKKLIKTFSLTTRSSDISILQHFCSYQIIKKVPQK